MGWKNGAAPAEVSPGDEPLDDPAKSKPELCASIVVLALPSGNTCCCWSQTKDGGGNQHKHICICSQFTLERV